MVRSPPPLGTGLNWLAYSVSSTDGGCQVVSLVILSPNARPTASLSFVVQMVSIDQALCMEPSFLAKFATKLKRHKDDKFACPLHMKHFTTTLNTTTTSTTASTKLYMASWWRSTLCIALKVVYNNCQLANPFASTTSATADRTSR